MEWASETLSAGANDLAENVQSTWASVALRMLEATQRRLAAGGDSMELDYTVLSVAFLTLGLILFVEILRHKIDQKAHGHPFAKTVLESVYRELSTLGIVEFAIFLGHTYATNFDVKIEAVFAKVHFLLFFTAIINALMSVLLAVVASRISDKMWVQTEDLDLNHYIAIREEFYRIEKKMGMFGTTPDERSAEHVQWLSCNSFRGGWVRLWRTIKYPMLKRKYDRLLVQVRFHELRVHFLQANNLPIKFRVSDYLVKSELHVFKKMVHISAFAWIMVAAAVNLCYFLMGMVAYVSRSQKIVGKWMTWIFIGSCISFIPISYAIFNKMKWIFFQIMHMKLIDHNANDDNGSVDNESINPNSVDDGDETHSRSEARSQSVLSPSMSKRGDVKGLALDQLDLFWGGDPHYVIGAFQFMQLGYAIAASILLIFWDFINVYYASVSAKWFIIALVACYVAFLYTMAQVVPRYTLCTSLGQLVNRRRLHETLAKYQLEEARRKRRHVMEEREIEEAMAREAEKNAKKRRSFAPPTVEEMRQRSQERSEVPPIASSALPRPGNIDRRSESSESERMAMLAELVKTSTEDLPKSDSVRARRERRKVSRLRSVSDGVAFMRRVTESGVSDAAANVLGSANDKKTPLPVPLVPTRIEAAANSDLLPTDVKDDLILSTTKHKRQRKRLQKSRSANVALMRSPTASLFAPSKLPDVGEEKEEEIPVEDNPKKVPKVSSQGNLQTLLEDIPSRSVGATDLSVPLGRASELSGTKPSKAHRLPNSTRTLDAPENVAATGTESLQPLDSQAAAKGVGGNILVTAEADDDDELDKRESGKDDDDTIGTAESEGGHSDFDDVPDINVAASVKSVKLQEPISTISFADRIRIFLLSQRYRVVSGVFGTLVAFFIVGMRVEILLISSGTIPDNKNTWHLGSLSGAFWWEVSWLSAFIAVSLFTLFLFWPHCRENEKLHIVVASISDIALCGFCLSLLLWAEDERCCESDPEVCCPKFGTRDYGGLGNIEPFTSLIALRTFRFQFGRLVRKLVRWCKRRGSDEEYPSLSDHRKRMRLACEYSGTFRPGHFDQTSHDDHVAGFENETGTVVELWKSAIGKFPDICEKYGEFSSELLQAMLGVEVIEDAVKKVVPTKLNSQSSAISDGGLSLKNDESEKHENAPELPKSLSPQVSTKASTKEDDTAKGTSPCPLKLSRKFSGLDPEAQGVILAGKIGRPVKTRHKTVESVDSLVFLSAEMSPSHSGEKGFELSPLSKKSTEFELDAEQTVEERNRDDESNLLFVEPNARLIRTMRRCERRLPPMLNEWAVVDVVLTKYELVYFDAIDDDNDICGEIPGKLHPLPEDKMAAATLQKKVHNVRRALIATKGGKGLRLRDVALGRRVVGHLELADIDHLKVERFPALPIRDGDKVDQFVEEDKEIQLGEYWKTTDSVIHTRLSTKYRWEHAMEDRLRLHSVQGNLYLRFFSDLEEWEVSPHDVEKEGEIKKNDTLLWCQTIARLCGSMQLHQKLPHFGEEGRTEILDFIDYVSREDDDTKKGAKNLHRRIRSRVNLAQLGEMMKAPSAQSSGHNRSKSDVPASKLDISNRDDVLSRGRAASVEDLSSKGRAPSVVRFALNGNGKDNTEDVGLPV